MAGLVRMYADFPLGAADASVVAIAERLGGNPRRNVGSPPLPGGASGALPGFRAAARRVNPVGYQRPAYPCDLL